MLGVYGGAKQLISWRGNERVQYPTIPFDGTHNDQKSPSGPHVSRILPLPNSAKLGTKLELMGFWGIVKN
jgi:hypothetical protein